MKLTGANFIKLLICTMFLISGDMLIAQQSKAKSPMSKSSDIPTGTPEQIAKQVTDRQQRELKLSTAQYKKIYDLNLRTARRNAMTPEQKKAQGNKPFRAYKDELKELLTAQQWNSLLAQVSANKAKKASGK